MKECRGFVRHTVFDEKAHLLISRSSTHGDLDVLQACRLGCRPMDTICPGCRSRHRCHVKLKIAHLSIEHVGRNPIGVIGVVVAVIGITINESNTVEVRRGFDGGKIGRISNNVGIVLINDGSRNQVCSRWEVHDCGSQSAGLAEPATSTP